MLPNSTKEVRGPTLESTTRRRGASGCCLAVGAFNSSARDNDHDLQLAWGTHQFKHDFVFECAPRPRLIINDDRRAGPPASYYTEHEQPEGLAVAKQAQQG